MFYERFLDLCNQKGITPAAAAREIGLSNATTTHWSHGTEPTLTSAYKVARYFNVSTDFLYGKTSEPASFDASAQIENLEVSDSEESARGEFRFDRFCNLCKARGKKQSYLYELVGMPSKAGSNLKRTKNIKPEILKIWADELRTSVAYLNNETDDPSAPETPPAHVEEKEKAPAAEGHGVTDEDLKFALFGGGDVTDAQFEEVKSFARFVRERDANGHAK